MQDHLHEDPALLLLKYSPTADFDLKEAVRQIAARQKAATKLPGWVSNPKVLFPASLSLEQSSSELTARFKTRLVRGKKLVDLTGGFGVDTFYMGQKFENVIYIERQEKLKDIVSHNFRLLGNSIDRYQFIATDSLAFLKESDEEYDWLYLDPARRGGNDQKLYKLADCEPDVADNWSLLTDKARNILIKVSPMLDIKAAVRELPDVRQVLVVAVKNEVKEVLLVWGKMREKAEVKISAFDLKGDREQRFDFTFEEEASAQVPFELPREYLMEPNAAIMKAGGFKSFALRYGLAKLHPSTHLYTASRIPEEIQGRFFKIIQEIKLDKKELKRLFPLGQVNVVVRNHPLKAKDLKKKYGLTDGGAAYLIATTTRDGNARVYWCEREM